MAWATMSVKLTSAGRSVRSSQIAYDNIAAANSGSDYRRPPLPLAAAQPMMYSGSESSRKRPLQPEGAAPMGRLLQPRPPQSYPGDYMQPAGPSYASALAGEPANKKKRGRPTKAESQQRAAEAALRGETYPPPRRGRVSITAPPEGSTAVSPSQQSEQRTPPSQPTPGLPAPATTPQHQMQTEQSSESSSGKKRRMKPHPLELDNPKRPMNTLESPLNLGSSDPNRSSINYSSFTPISAPLPSSDSRDRDSRMEGVEETQPRTTTPHSFKDTVGI